MVYRTSDDAVGQTIRDAILEGLENDDPITFDAMVELLLRKHPEILEKESQCQTN